MMRQYELVERIQRYKPEVNEALLNKAYVYAMQKHGDQKRASGDPYFSHPLEVAAILTEMRLDESTVAVGLLHDTIEDTSATRREIEELFGDDIGRLVDGLTKLNKLDLVSKRAAQAENLRKLLLAIADDVRVLLVKLADRLHNMRTLEHVPEHKRTRISEETMDIYAPLAGRMGMQDMREELEDLAFRNINPEAYRTITGRLVDLNTYNRETLGEITETLHNLLAEKRYRGPGLQQAEKALVGVSQDGIQGPVLRAVVRRVRLSHHRRQRGQLLSGARCRASPLEHRSRTLQGLHLDTEAERLPLDPHDHCRAVETTCRIADSNAQDAPRCRIRGRRARDLQGCVGGRKGQWASVQRPSRRCRFLGLQGHQRYAWLRRTIESLSEGDNPEEFLENTKLELFQDQVFCFTPKGRLIALPRGATPVDFAYAVHTDIGNSCVGAKINGRVMPLVTRLQNGDEVEIVRSDAQTPPIAWEQVVVTGKARSAIRRAARMAIRKQYAGLGHRILDRAFERAGKAFSRDGLKPGVKRLGFKDIEDVLAAVGRGEIPSDDVVRAVFPEYEEAKPVSLPAAGVEGEGWFNLTNASGMMFRIPGSDNAEDGVAVAASEAIAQAVPIRGAASDMPVRFAPEGAVPGDRIIGISTPGKGITIYPIQSSALAAFDDQPERWIDVRWDLEGSGRRRFAAQIVVTAINAPGSLADIAQIIGDLDANIHTLSMVRTAPDFTEMIFDLEVWDLKHLNAVIGRLRDADAVSTAERTSS